MPRLSKFLRLVRRYQPFTVTGRVLLAALVFGCLAVLDSSVTAMLSCLLWMLIFAFGYGLLYRPNLAVRAEPLCVAVKGERFRLSDAYLLVISTLAVLLLVTVVLADAEPPNEVRRRHGTA